VKWLGLIFTLAAVLPLSGWLRRNPSSHRLFSFVDGRNRLERMAELCEGSRVLGRRCTGARRISKLVLCAEPAPISPSNNLIFFCGRGVSISGGSAGGRISLLLTACTDISFDNRRHWYLVIAFE
jgi:hypothetical protein